MGSCRGYLYIWDIRSGIKDDHMRYKYHTAFFPKCIITAVLSDNDFLVSGDNDGNLVLLDTDGNKIYYLNAPQTTEEKKVDIESIPISQLGRAFRNKVSKILRVGRWIIATFENGRVELYDIFTPDMASPVDVYVNQNTVSRSGSTLRDILANGKDGEIMMLYSGGKNTHTGKTQTRPVFVSWAPQIWNSEDVFSKKDGDGDTEGFVDIINATMARVKGKINSVLGRKRAEISTADLVDLDEKLFPSKVVPFYCFQKIMRNLDDIEKYLGKIVKSGNISKYKKRLGEHLSHHKRFVYLARASVDFIYKNSMLRSSDMVPVKLCDVQPFVRVVTRYEEKENLSEGDAQRIDMIANDHKKSSSSSDPVLAMLERLCRSLRVSHIELCMLVNKFDTVCGMGINNSDKIVPLVDVYRLLLQMKEDAKEMGRRTGETGTGPLDDWYENGGEYKEAIVPITSSK